MPLLPALLAALAPIVVHDGDERHLLSAVGGGPPRAYVRDAGAWRQFWLYYDYNAQDRGIVRTGRHEGDWELVQVRLVRGRPVEAVFAQHAGAERCDWAQVERRGGRFVVYSANGSHAAYFRAGVRDRTWPDPNDEADGRGAAVTPRVEALGPWARRPGLWGRSRAGWVPGEQSSPPSPAFQPDGRWSDPEAWARSASPCRAARCDERGECDGAETAAAGGAGAMLLAAIGLRRWRTRTRR